MGASCATAKPNPSPRSLVIAASPLGRAYACRRAALFRGSRGTARGRGVMPAFAGMTLLPPHGRLEAGGFGFALGAEPALAARLLDAAAVVVGRPGQHVDALAARHQALDGAA